MLWWKFANILMSCSKLQGSFSSNFTLLFSSMKDSSSVLSYVKDYILCTKGTNQSANFGEFWVPRSKFTNSCRFWNSKLVFLQILHQPSVSISITPLYFFLAEIVSNFNKRSLPKYKFDEINLSSWNFPEILGLWCVPFVKMILCFNHESTE